MSEDKERIDLGMNRPIARRDFISGVAVGASALAMHNLAQAAGMPSSAAVEADTYPPLRTGMRGQHAGSFESAHAARDGKFNGTVAIDQETDEVYDLVVVGAGISGLSAAHFFRRNLGEDMKVLILDNHDDFGGHAKRNEFRYNGRIYLGYGGTMSIETPYPYSYMAKSLISELGITVEKYDANHRNDKLYAGLTRGMFFDKEHFGTDKLVTGFGQKPWDQFFAEAPLAAQVRADLTRLYTQKVDYMPDLDPVAKAAALKKMSYKDFLLKHVKVTPEAMPFFNGTGFRNNMRVDTCPAYTAAGLRGAGFAGMKIDAEKPFHTDYEAHFPDGNATIARLLINRLVPAALPGTLDMKTVVTAPLDYSKLDLPSSAVRVRLSSMVVRVQHDGDAKTSREVSIIYVKDGKNYRVRGGNVIMACFNNIIRFIVPDLPEKQKVALAYASKVPMQYTNVFLRNWQSFKKLGVSAVSSPNGYHTGMNLDTPISMGDYTFAASPDDPIVVHMTRNPNAPGLPRKEQHRRGRMDMLTTPFEKAELEIRRQMARTFGGGGFDPAKDILGITVNRWPHGYAYTYDTLGDPDFAENERPHVIGRQAFGRIAIANADAGAAAFTNEAIDQAHRAVHDCLYSRGYV